MKKIKFVIELFLRSQSDARSAQLADYQALPVNSLAQTMAAIGMLR